MYCPTMLFPYRDGSSVTGSEYGVRGGKAPILKGLPPVAAREETGELGCLSASHR